jgi:hypothetical protein
MRKSSGLILAACLLAASPVFAGNLTLENGQTAWTSTQCPKPAPKEEWKNVDSNANGDEMNSLSTSRLSWAGAMQSYINCVAAESDKDQTMVNQTIAASAQSLIDQAQAEVNGPKRK